MLSLKLIHDCLLQMSPEEWSHIQESLMLMMDNMCLGTEENYEDTYQESDGQMVTLMTTDGQVKHYHKETLEVKKIKQDIVHLQGQKRISCTTTLLKKAYTYIDKYLGKKSFSYIRYFVWRYILKRCPGLVCFLCLMAYQPLWVI